MLRRLVRYADRYCRADLSGNEVDSNFYDRANDLAFLHSIFQAI